MTKNQFRLLTILSVGFGLGGAVWDIAVPLPPALEAFQASEEIPIDRMGLMGTIIVLAVLALFVLSTILLLIFHRLAPMLFVALNALTIPMTPLLGYWIYSPVSGLLTAVATFCGGAMMAIIFTTDVRKFFGEQTERQAAA